MEKKALIISSVVLLLALGGAAGWFFYTGDLMRWIGMAEAEASLPAETTDGEEPAPVPQPRLVSSARSRPCRSDRCFLL